MKVFKEDKGVPIKAWVDGVQIEDAALKQLINLSKLPFIQKHIAVMPDVHYGKGSTIGSVIATKGVVIPAAVGVDIGCGMIAVKTSIRGCELPDNLHAIRTAIQLTIPHGMETFQPYYTNGIFNKPHSFVNTESSYLLKDYNQIILKYPTIQTKSNPMCQLGTLGGGNHFIEICLDQNNNVWLMLHSGSRGIGNSIGNFFIEKAKNEMIKYHIVPYLADMDLSYLVEHTELYTDYIQSVKWAQNFAYLNRRIMMKLLIGCLSDFIPNVADRILDDEVISCHHNYISIENHFNKNLLITRKGAVSAKMDQMGIIPGSMGTKSYIVKGKGNKDSFHSCSHGAGRLMSRNKAKEIFSITDHLEATKGIECKKDESVLDETPGAYKNIDHVMAAQCDLVDIVYTLNQILCVKG